MNSFKNTLSIQDETKYIDTVVVLLLILKQSSSLQ